MGVCRMKISWTLLFFWGVPNISSSVSVKESHLRAAVEAVESVKGVKEGRSKGRITRKEGRKSKRGEGEVNHPLPPQNV